MRDRGLQGRFSHAVARAASSATERVDDLGARGGARRDLRALPTFTIDPASARDFDDALSAQQESGGAARVWVHIADVAAFVQEDSPVDVEARRRGTSVYVPGGVEPMLPEVLSNDACSLVPGAERLAVTVELALAGAEVVDASFYRSLIRSDARLDYDLVDRIFGGQEQALAPWAGPLAAARAAAAALQEQRERGGALVVDSPEPEFGFDRQGNVSEIRAVAQTEAHRLIEHLMIAANEAVARLLERGRIPCLYRVHERPDAASVARLVDQLASLDVPTPALPDHPSPSQAAAAVGEISRLIDAAVRRRGRGRIALSSLVLRSLKQAYYSPRNIGHAGLGSSAYCHFTSPIRRYPDLVCHRALLSALGEPERAPRARDLAELGEWTSDRERAAMQLERDADDIARSFALEQALYQEGFEQSFSGEVVGLIGAGAFIAFGGPLVSHSARRGGQGKASAQDGAQSQARAQDGTGMHVYEGLLPVRHLRSPGSVQRVGERAAQASRGARQRGAAKRGGDWWELNELGTILQASPSGATLRLGDEVQVCVARVDAPRGRAELVPAPEPEEG
jgi:ribonuclease R